MDSKGKIRLYFLLELLVWLFVIIIGVSAFRYHSIKKQRALKSYQIFMQDIDGLIVGSPVRIMGVPVGYISNIKIIQDHVYVKFVITQQDFTLPKGVIATVEFNGMGGSKSLELYTPDEYSKASGNLIAIKPTNRLGAALGLLNDMFDKIGSIMVRCEIFNDGIAKMYPKSDSHSNTPIADAVETVDEASNSVNQAANLIDLLNKKRINLKGKVKGLYNEQTNAKSN